MNLLDKNKIKEYWRVVKIARRPDTKEFLIILKIVAAGTVIIGAIGLIITIVATLLA